jgi:hypothetical protein
MFSNFVIKPFVALVLAFLEINKQTSSKAIMISESRIVHDENSGMRGVEVEVTVTEGVEAGDCVNVGDGLDVGDEVGVGLKAGLLAVLK